MDAITPITFTNPDVAANFVALTDKDVSVRTVAVTANGTVPQYTGKLSNITRAAAAGMVRRNNNLIALKAGITLEATASPSPSPSSTSTPTSTPTVATPTVDAKQTSK